MICSVTIIFILSKKKKKKKLILFNLNPFIFALNCWIIHLNHFLRTFPCQCRNTSFLMFVNAFCDTFIVINDPCCCIVYTVMGTLSLLLLYITRITAHYNNSLFFIFVALLITSFSQPPCFAVTLFALQLSHVYFWSAGGNVVLLPWCHWRFFQTDLFKSVL